MRKILTILCLFVSFKLSSCQDCLKQLRENINQLQESIDIVSNHSECGLDIIELNYLTGILDGQIAAFILVENNHFLESHK